MWGRITKRCGGWAPWLLLESGDVVRSVDVDNNCISMTSALSLLTVIVIYILISYISAITIAIVCGITSRFGCQPVCVIHDPPRPALSSRFHVPDGPTSYGHLAASVQRHRIVPTVIHSDSQKMMAHVPARLGEIPVPHFVVD